MCTCVDDRSFWFILYLKGTHHITEPDSAWNACAFLSLSAPLHVSYFARRVETRLEPQKIKRYQAASGFSKNWGAQAWHPHIKMLLDIHHISSPSRMVYHTTIINHCLGRRVRHRHKTIYNPSIYCTNHPVETGHLWIIWIYGITCFDPRVMYWSTSLDPDELPLETAENPAKSTVLMMSYI